MSSINVIRSIGAVGVLVAIGFAAAAGQSPQPEPRDSTAALLEEVRGLRAELRHAAASSTRMQLLIGRLSLQEGRVASINHQILDLQRQLEPVRQKRAELEREVETFRRDDLPAEQRAVAPMIVKELHAQLADLSKTEQRFRTREQELLTLLADEQSRWTSFNAELDELDRAAKR